VWCLSLQDKSIPSTALSFYPSSIWTCSPSLHPLRINTSATLFSYSTTGMSAQLCLGVPVFPLSSQTCKDIPSSVHLEGRPLTFPSPLLAWLLL
jgi:hypothetical protein